MKSLLFLIVALFGLNASSIESVMNCTIKKQAIYNSDDKKIGEFAGYKDSLKVGDTYKLRYELNDNKLHFVMDDSSLLDPTVYYFANLNNSKIDGMYGYVNIQPDSLLDGHKSSIGKDSISLSVGMNWLHSFKRYHKDNWMGASTYQIVRNSSITNHTVFWNCKYITTPKFDEIYNRLNKLK